jgi:hypothetical protein
MCHTRSPDAPRRRARALLFYFKQWDKVHDLSSSSDYRKIVHMLLTPTILAPCQRLEIRNRSEDRQEKKRNIIFFELRNNLTEKRVRAALPARLEAPSGRAVDPGDALAQNCVPCDPGATCAVETSMHARFISSKIPVLKRGVLLNSNL